MAEKKPESNPKAAKNPNSKKDAGKAKKKKSQDALLYWSIAFIIAAIILFFALSKFFSKEQPYPSVEYDHWVFTEVGGMWWFEWQKEGKLYSVPLRNNPYEAESVPISGNFDSTAFNSKSDIYITFDLSNESSQDLAMLALAAAELTQNMATAIGRIPVAACMNNKSDACLDRPIKQCEGAEEPVIYLREGGNDSITLNKACIMIEGNGFGIVRAVDRLLYQWYGIIK